MDKKVLAISPRLFSNPTRRTQAPPIRVSPALPPQHPALSYASEGVAIHNSLDLSFQHAVSVSRLDRQIIDNLSHVKQPLQYAELLAS